MGRLRSLLYLFGRPAFAIPCLTFMAAGLLTGLGRLLFDDWLIAGLSALGILLVFLLGFLLWSVLAREHERKLQAGLEVRVTRSPEVSSERSDLGALEHKFLGGLSDWGRAASARQLPWYLVLGESGAGKTTALADCGLELPADTSRFVEPGPTRSIAWWPTNQAILLDTAGRYVEDEEARTRREWRRLLRLIRRQGRRVPLQGIVVAVSLRSLLTEDEARTQARAHRLRRRLNEVATELRIDAPIYVLITQADAMEGLVELAGALPHARLDEALGWTHAYRRYSDPGAALCKAFRATLDRIERLLPDALMREPDPVRRRRLFLFPDELEASLERIGAFLDRAFGRSVYGAMPFLRGVYLSSAVQHGETASPHLERLGHAWAVHAVDTFRPQRGLFQRDLFRRIIVDREEATLATPARELSPLLRRTLLGLGGACAAGAVVLFGMAVASQWIGLRTLANDLVPAQVQRPTLETLDALRSTSLAVEERHRSFWRRMGLTSVLDGALDTVRATVAERFEQRFERPTKARMLQEADQIDERAFTALSALALDVSWLASGSEGEPPDLSRFLECRGCGPRAPEAFREMYAAWARWDPARARARAVEEQQALRKATPTLLTLRNVERWCAAESELCRPVRFEDFGLPTPQGCGGVRGAYTQATWDALIARLVAAVRGSGQASQVDVERFMKEYRRAYGQEWESFVRCTPMQARPELPAESSYVRLLARLGENLGPGSQWSEAARAPAWFERVRALTGDVPVEGQTEDPTEGQEESPASVYRALIDTLTADVQRVRAQPRTSLAAARRAVQGADDPYREGLVQIERLVPIEGNADRAVHAKLRALLELPVLNGFSATLAVARDVIDAQWRDRIVSPYSGSLRDVAALRALYAPQSGALAQFESEWLDGFYGQEGPTRLLRGRSMLFGSDFGRWIRKGRVLQRGLFSAEERSIRIEAFPGELEGRPGVYLTERTLELECASGVQTFRHANAGSGRDNAVFRWSPDCDVVRLRLETQSTGGAREALPEKIWTGPFALGEFLREADRSDGRYRWLLRYDGGVSARVAYRVIGGEVLEGFAHRSPPRSVTR